MKKLTLNLEQLTVETFVATPRDEEEQGTVRGFAGSTQLEVMCTCETWENPSCYRDDCGPTGYTCSCGCTSGSGDRTDEYNTCMTGWQINCVCGAGTNVC